jgi:hypothetical protein
VILVLAGMRDADVVSFSGAFRPLPAAVLALAELAVERSSLRHPNFARSTVTVEGRSLAVGEIAGVVNLLPAVVPDALRAYAPAEREYQASEANAWLLFFLSALECPVVNRPTTLSLSGPVLNPLGWHQLARSAGIPVSAVRVDSAESANPLPLQREGLVEVVSVGWEIIAPSGTEADRHTTRLAEWANVEYLKARYAREGRTGVRFVGASSVPTIRRDPERTALVRYFTR